MFAAFPHIDQFRHVVATVNRMEGASRPTLEFQGTVKSHGTNAAIRLEADGTVHGQSRGQDLERVVEEDGDVVFRGHYGFGSFLTARTQASGRLGLLRDLFREVAAAAISSGLSGVRVGSDPDSVLSTTTRPLLDPDVSLVIFGEWVGKGVQKGVGLSNLAEKAFVIFAAALARGDEKAFIPISMISDDPASGIVNVQTRTDVYRATVDFSSDVKLAEALEGFARLTADVESACPLAAALGVPGTGEGVVWTCVTPGFESDANLWFKTKGQKHSATKVTVTKPGDVGKAKWLAEFAESTVSDVRVEQGIRALADGGVEVSRKSTTEFLRWMVGDIAREERDVIEASGFAEREINSVVGRLAAKRFSDFLARDVGQGQEMCGNSNPHEA